MEPRARVELATCRLRSVNQTGAAECDGQLRCSIFFTLCALADPLGFLLSVMVCDLGVHQIVHQVSTASVTCSQDVLQTAGKNRPAAILLRS